MTNDTKIEFTPETLALVKRIILRYPEGREKSALIPILHVAQAEFDGWLSVAAMDYVASLLNIQPIEVYEVATFYTMFNTKPIGKCVIEVCRTGPCWIMGADELIQHLEHKLGIKTGETTADGRFSLREVECLANCGKAPVVQVGWKQYENVSADKMNELLNTFEAEHTVSHENPYFLP